MDRTSKLLPFAYYQAMHVHRGIIGRPETSASYKHIHADAMEMQRELARKLSEASYKE